MVDPQNQTPVRRADRWCLRFWRWAAYPCATCAAARNEPCINLNNATRLAQYPHAARYDALAEATR